MLRRYRTARRSAVTRHCLSGAPARARRDFARVAALVAGAKRTAARQVNRTLIDLYWRIGQFICQRVASAGWGMSVVEELSWYLQHTFPDQAGLSAQNLWRMKQLVEIYGSYEKLSPLVRELSWTNHLTIMAKARSPEEREFYLRLCAREGYSKRELERQFASGLFERAVVSRARSARAALRSAAVPASADDTFRDSYVLDFLGLPAGHSEADLRTGIVRHLKEFILEFGRDFAFVGEQYRLQVGNRDFYVDLLFFHRELRCLVAFELKIDEFEPAHLGQLSFYLEALDHHVRKPHENPSVGVILCKSRDREVVRFALSRTLSPAVVARYETRLPDRKLLEQKLHEFFDVTVRETGALYMGEALPAAEPVMVT